MAKVNKNHLKPHYRDQNTPYTGGHLTFWVNQIEIIEKQIAFLVNETAPWAEKRLKRLKKYREAARGSVLRLIVGQVNKTTLSIKHHQLQGEQAA